MGRQREWRATPSGWWRGPHDASYYRWRRARQLYFCFSVGCYGSIEPGARYVETVAAPWHEFVGEVYRDNKIVRVWTHARLCDNHPDSSPPA